MSDGGMGIEADLLSENNELWSVLGELARTPEADRRRILRPHLEVGFLLEQEREIIQQRRRLDAALGFLTWVEIGFEIGLFSPAETALPQLEALKVLFGSEAFLGYADAYLYFGIRLLAGRIAAPDWMKPGPVMERRSRTSNERPFALLVPPGLPYSTQADSRFAALISLSRQMDPGRGPLRQQALSARALAFLDGFTAEPREPDWFELWLRGLRPETDAATEARFAELSDGLRDWVLSRSAFYLSLQPAEPPAAPPAAPAAEQAIPGKSPLPEPGPDARPLGGWVVTNPLAARFGLSDMYWIAHLLRADVSAQASVTYRGANWLHLLRFHAVLRGDHAVGVALSKAEEVLRSVFDFVCDLVQNAVELTAQRDRETFERALSTPAPDGTVPWRAVLDEEMEEIDRQRARRRFEEDKPFHRRAPQPGPAQSATGRHDGWTERIKSGSQPQNLIGLAFSGGGIRSATFNLGVLQGLQEFDLLRHFDYISTVSGGGFIGCWLVGNVRRTAHWLGRLTSWEESISHLRRYSNYLAPRTGVLSADTWVMWASWARNAFLIQLTGLTWLLALLLVGFAGRVLFVAAGRLPGIGSLPVTGPGVLAGLLCLAVLASLLYNLTGERAVTGKGAAFSAVWVRRVAVLPSWLASFLVAALLWGDATGRTPFSPVFKGLHSYSAILKCAWSPWEFLLAVVVVALAAIAFATMTRRRWHALWISPLCALVLYLELCGLMRVFLVWSAAPARFGWYAYVLGPALVLAANVISVVIFIGLCGRNSNESVREWWTRFGAWLAMSGVAYLATVTAAVFGPLWMLHLFGSAPGWVSAIKWGGVASWAGTVLAGLLAGKSSKTAGNEAGTRSPLLEILARLGGLLFIVGAVLLSALLLYVLLVNIGTDQSAGDLGRYWTTLGGIPLWVLFVSLVAALLCGSLFSAFFEINIFGLNQFYRNRLVRCYLGATRWAPGYRSPQPFIKFDGEDDLRLKNLTSQTHPEGTAEFRGPFPIFNCTLNLGGSGDLGLNTRHSASFSLTPLRCGADRRKVGYAPTQSPAGDFADGVMLGQAVAISGAAASPNMGYNTSPLVAFLLTMFNVRLGWWFPNPGQADWNRHGLRFSLYYLLRELFGLADEKSRFVNVSDGGHFENLGIYELIRRRCKVIVAADAECDEFLQFGGLGNVVRICETDFGAKIDIDVTSIRRQKDGHSLGHCTVGKIMYSNGSIGYLIYLKASVTGDEDVDIAQYRSSHPSFPHESTADQFFSEDQFESYRKLGLHVVQHSFRGSQQGESPVAIAEKLADVLVASGCGTEVFLKHSAALDRIWEQFRRAPHLHDFFAELMQGRIAAPSPVPQNEERLIALELFQLMEDVFLDLRLDDFWSHPDNRGWAILFMRWARSPRLRAIWAESRRTFGIRFEYFCEARLGLPRDNPIVRV